MLQFKSGDHHQTAKLYPKWLKFGHLGFSRVHAKVDTVGEIGHMA